MSKRLANWFSVPVLVALSVVGCAGKTIGGDPNDLTIETFPERFASAMCGTYGGCCRAIGEPFDDAACQARWRAAGLINVIDAAGVNRRFDRNAARRCLSEIAKGSQGCLDAGPSYYSSCYALVVGTLPLGATCQTSAECAGQREGVNCFTEVYGTPWTCAVGGVFLRPHGDVGETCSATCSNVNFCSTPNVRDSMLAIPATNVACFVEDGLYCASDAHCAQLRGVGESCADFSACVIGARCSVMANECVVPEPDGAPCREDSECIHAACSGTCYTPPLITPAGCAYQSSPAPT